MNSQQAVPNGAADRTVHLAGLLIHRSDPQSIDCIRWGPGDPQAVYREERPDTGRDPSAPIPTSKVTSQQHVSLACYLQLAPVMSSCHAQVGKQEFLDSSLVLNDILGGLLKIRL